MLGFKFAKEIAMNKNFVSIKVQALIFLIFAVVQPEIGLSFAAKPTSEEAQRDPASSSGFSQLVNILTRKNARLMDQVNAQDAKIRELEAELKAYRENEGESHIFTGDVHSVSRIAFNDMACTDSGENCIPPANRVIASIEIFVSVSPRCVGGARCLSPAVIYTKFIQVQEGAPQQVLDQLEALERYQAQHKTVHAEFEGLEISEDKMNLSKIQRIEILSEPIND